MRCKSCNHIQLCHGNAILSFTTHQFNEFIDLVNDQYEVYKNYEFADEKAIKIPTVLRTITLIYSLNEIKALKELLVNGRNKLEMDKLLVLHEN